MGVFKQLIERFASSKVTTICAIIFAASFYLHNNPEMLDIFGKETKEKIIWFLTAARGTGITLGLLFASDAIGKAKLKQDKPEPAPVIQEIQPKPPAAKKTRTPKKSVVKKKVKSKPKKIK